MSFWFIRDKTFGAVRSGRWPKVRKEYLKIYPLCKVCGRKGKPLKQNEVHHIIPVFIDNLRELDETNFITLCGADHFTFGHLKSWRSYNSEITEDAKIWAGKIKDRN